MADTVVVIAAHADDEVLGCGGTIAKLAREGKTVHILLLADGESSRESSGSARSADLIAQRQSAAEEACGILGAASVSAAGLPDNRLDSVILLDIVKPVELFIAQHSPLSVFTHHAGDVNIDHRKVHDAVIAACRPQPGYSVTDLMFFEVASSTEWRPPNSAPMFAPTCFVDITDTLDVKMKALNAYAREMREFPHPRSATAIQALAQWRGATAGMRAAEAFEIGRKLIHRESVK
jgi:LmbE family N-acetylglucosaminyl deacetylase